jgi:RHS repeat-associated protein
MTFDKDNRLLAFNGSIVSIDFAGNLTYGPLTNNTFGTYTYDPRNELTSAGGLNYGYDPAGNRTSTTNGTNIAVYVIDPKTSQVLIRIKGGITNYYVYGTGLLYESDETAASIKTAFYHHDCRGSTVTLTDSNGIPTDVIQYSPYGATTYRAGTNDTPFLYNGQFGVQTDPNGLLYMRARYYNPYISRFLNSDPNGFGGGLNFYLFCNGNPVSDEDPFGLGGASYGNPVSGPFGEVGPSSLYVPGGQFYNPLPYQPTPFVSFVTGTTIGSTIAAGVIVAAPVAASVVGAGIVDAALLTAAAYGGYSTIVNTSQSAGSATVTGNWNGAALNVGVLVGGGLVGVSGGGRTMVEGMMGEPSTSPNTWNPYVIFQNEVNKTLNPFQTGGSIPGWLASSPTPFGGGLSATGVAAAETSQSSSTGKTPSP